MKLLKKMTPMMLATMMLAPSVLIEEAMAQRDRNGERRDRDGRNGSGDTSRPGDTNSTNLGARGEILAERDFGNWDQRYIGRRSFKLTDDNEYNTISIAVTNAKKDLDQKTSVLAAQEKKVRDAQQLKASIDKEIGDLSKAIVDGLSEQTKLKNSLAQLRRAAQNAKEQRDVAKAGADSTQETVQNINAKIEAAQANLQTIEEACQATPAADCSAKITEAKNKVAQEREPLRAAIRLNRVAQENLKAKEGILTNKRKDLQEAQDKISKITTDNEERAVILEQKKNALKNAIAKVTAEQAALSPLKSAYDESLTVHNRTMLRKNRIIELLVTRVIRLNRVGAEVGEEAGSIDGDLYAEYLGIPAGQQDGDRDGTEAGQSAGRRASYNRGLGQGEIQGRAEAEARGERDGLNQGHYQGHVAAATEDGRTDGLNQANNSDAAQVGTNQGQEAGLERAKIQGERDGNAKGERQAIEKHEKGNLNSQNVNGNFAGAFAPMVPSYPGFNCIESRGRRYTRDDFGWRTHRNWRADNTICPNFRPREHSDMTTNNRGIFREAFMDGYIQSYRHNRRGQFNQSIDRLYMSNYESARMAAFEDFSSREYPAQTEEGRQAGFNAAFDARYPVVKEEARKIAYAQALANPDTGSSEYQQTYTDQRQATYNRRYEEIRVANFNATEVETFDQNIAQQTELFRESRFATVDAIYQNNPVVKFESSEMKDGGVRGVAKADGIFQPGEVTLHNVTITNFGDKAANNVTVSLDNGERVKLPSIPEKSTTTIKGALKSEIEGRLGSVEEKTLQAFSPLSAEARIQGRHYYATSTARLNFGDKKKVDVTYPLALSNLKTQSQLLINEANSLSISVTNKSGRKYSGALTIELNDNAQTDIITKDFDTISDLGQGRSTTLSSAKILVTNERDVFKDLSFSALIKKDGVIIGQLDNALNTMVKAPYSPKNGKPVFLVDSSKNARDLINALEEIGGLTNGSVIDLSLARLNRDVLNQGLNKKMIVALDDLRGSTIPGVSALLKNSEDTVLLFVDSRNAGLNLARNNSGVLRNASLLPVFLKGNDELFNLRFTNPYLDGVKEMTVAAQTTPNGMKDAMRTLSGLMKTNNELVTEAGSTLNQNNALQTSAKVQNMIVMATAEILNVNEAYKKTNNDRFENLAIDSKMLYSRILEHSGKKVNRNTLSKNLSAFTMYQVIDHALDNFDPVDDRMDQDIELKIEDHMRDTIKGTGLFRIGKGLRDNLRKEYKSLYNNLDENPFVQSPFRM
jgi:hypothetical protein